MSFSQSKIEVGAENIHLKIFFPSQKKYKLPGHFLTLRQHRADKRQKQIQKKQ